MYRSEGVGPERRIFFLCVLEVGWALARCASVRASVRPCVRASAPCWPAGGALLAIISATTSVPTQRGARPVHAGGTPAALRRLLVAEVVASETPERCRSLTLEKELFNPLVMLDLLGFASCRCSGSPIVCWQELARVLLSCFTGYHFSDIHYSGASLAII